MIELGFHSSPSSKIWLRCGHCKKKFRTLNAIMKHWKLYCPIRPMFPSIINCTIEKVINRDMRERESESKQIREQVNDTETYPSV